MGGWAKNQDRLQVNLILSSSRKSENILFFSSFSSFDFCSTIFSLDHFAWIISLDHSPSSWLSRGVGSSYPRVGVINLMAPPRVSSLGS
jgi:hypothetical protein